MTRTNWLRRVRWAGISSAAALALSVAGPCAAGSPRDAAGLVPGSDAIARGGLIVHVGCGDGERATALAAREGVLVLALDVDRARVAETRRRALRLGRHGVVTADVFDGVELPLIDNVANLVIAEEPGGLTVDEVRRVLVPGGTALLGDRKMVKPRPEGIDDWTHYLHDASNNAVARDEVVGPPRHLQWQCGPRWSRHHDHMASVSALVSAGGRVFYIIDEGSRFSPQLPPSWKLVARDAFNGVLLWKRPLGEWFNTLWPLKSGPANLPRRLVAMADRVYVTLSIDAPVTALDAVTGETVRTYAGTEAAEELLVHDGTLLALVHRTPLDPEADLQVDSEEGRSRDRRTTYSDTMRRIWAGVRSPRWAGAERSVVAVDAASGRGLWRLDSRVMPLTLAADSERVYFHDGDRVVAVARATGRREWVSPPAAVWKGLEGQGLQSWFAPSLVVQGGKVLFAGGEKMHMSYMGWGSKDIGEDTMSAFDVATGEKLWTAPHPYSGYNSPEDLFVIGGRVWTGRTAKGDRNGRYIGRDVDTGELDVEFPPTVDTHWFHHRCHRAKATSRYVLCSRTGIELVDLSTGTWDIHHWVRGGCLYGIMPANGLIYTPPHPCACYPEAKLYGFTALASASSLDVPPSRPLRPRLERGPAFDATGGGGSAGDDGSAGGDGDWPTYRGGPARSGSTTAPAPAAPRVRWRVRVGGKLSQPVAGGDRIFVADAAGHQVHAIDRDTGAVAWTFPAGGPIDSAPTFRDGRLLFGSRDGHVYCLRARGGELAWRFRAAPRDLRLVAFERVESVWPVHGSVLVEGDECAFVAGRSMFLDGGLRVCRLDVRTGRLLAETRLDDRDPATGEDLQIRVRGLNMPVALPDILSSDGEHLFMRSQVMGRQGRRTTLGPGASGRRHLFAPYGFTDESWFHRTYWIYGDVFRGGVGGFGSGKTNPAGRILVHDGSTVFGYGRKPKYYQWGSVIDYHLFAVAMEPAEAATAPESAPDSPGLTFAKAPSLNPRAKPLTIAAWIRAKARDGTILVRGANICGFALTLHGGRPRMLMRAGGKTHVATGDDPIGDDWTHVAGTLGEDGRMEVWVDGERVGGVEGVPLPNRDPQVSMKVGHDDTHQLLSEPLAPFDGALDEVRLYHRALSRAEIGRLADPGAEVTSRDGEVLHLDFEGGKLRDRSPAGNHGRSAARPKIVRGPVGDALLLEPAREPDTAADTAARRRRSAPSGKTGPRVLWTRDVPVTVRAMALAGDRLLVAGPRDLLDEDLAFQGFGEKDVTERILAQDAAIRGASGGVLQVVDAATGETLSEQPLESPPVFDGLSVSERRVYVATIDGRVICLGQ